MANITTNLKKFRTNRGLSQTQLGALVGVGARYIAFIESGQKCPSMKVAFKIAQTLHARVDDIFLPAKCTNSTDKK